MPASDVKEPDTHFVQAELVGEVRFGEWTQAGRLRHPAWRGLRPDKAPRMSWSSPEWLPAGEEVAIRGFTATDRRTDHPQRVPSERQTLRVSSSGCPLRSVVVRRFVLP